MHFRGIKQEKILPMRADNKSGRLSRSIHGEKFLEKFTDLLCDRIRVFVNSNFFLRFLCQFFDSSANLRNSNDFDGKSWGMRDIHRKLYDDERTLDASKIVSKVENAKVIQCEE